MQNPDRIPGFVQTLRDYGVPPQWALPLVLKLCGLSIHEVAEWAGTPRTYAYAILLGRRPMTEALRTVVTDVLGCDAWAILVDATDSEARSHADVV